MPREAPVMNTVFPLKPTPMAGLRADHCRIIATDG
jgi:hypothetical protein